MAMSSSYYEVPGDAAVTGTWQPQQLPPQQPQQHQQQQPQQQQLQQQQPPQPQPQQQQQPPLSQQQWGQTASTAPQVQTLQWQQPPLQTQATLAQQWGQPDATGINDTAGDDTAVAGLVVDDADVEATAIRLRMAGGMAQWVLGAGRSECVGTRHSGGGRCCEGRLGIRK